MIIQCQKTYCYAAAMLLLAFAFTQALQAEQIQASKVQGLVSRADVAGLRALGPDVLPVLAKLYEAGDENQRASIAQYFYQLGWTSPEAKRALMKDVHTQNQNLRLQVQWALGRVSGDLDVVEVLLNNMKADLNPLFRDKAACALANDQIHLTERQKARLFQGLIEALGDPKPDVRRIALQALSIQTGQTKGFNPNGSPSERQAQMLVWKKWLEEYQSNL
jgi:HEAT repeat protein